MCIRPGPPLPRVAMPVSEHASHGPVHGSRLGRPGSRVTWEADRAVMPRKKQHEISEPSPGAIEEESPEPELEPIS